jgi:Holliday junction resolvasome RuvABC endonuclease subunit
MKKQILALDVAFTNIGWALIEPYTDGEKIIALGTVENKSDPHQKKRGIRDSDIDMDRMQKLYAGIQRVIDKHRPYAVIGEIPGGGGKSSKSVAGMAKGKCVVAIVTYVNALPAEWTTESEGKMAMTGRKDASKLDMQAAVVKKFPDAGKLAPKSKRSKSGYEGWFEHSADAIAAYEAARYGMLRKMTAQLNGSLK